MVSEVRFFICATLSSIGANSKQARSVTALAMDISCIEADEEERARGERKDSRAMEESWKRQGEERDRCLRRGKAIC